MKKFSQSFACITLVVAATFTWLAAASAEVSSPRQKFSLNPDWRFIREDVTGAEKPDFDASSWKTVSCPHTWNDVDSFDDFAKGGHQGESDLWTGAAWYRKEFMLPEADKGKKVFIEFEGVRQVADVYLNGHHLGQDMTGFIPFGFDLTPYLKFCGTNVLAVRADNTVDEQYQGDTPWNHPNWHPPHGGIYRNVWLHVMDAVHVTLPLHSHLGSEGIYAWTSSLTKEKAEIGVTAEIANDLKIEVEAVVRFSITDPRGKVVASVEKPAKIAAGARDKVAASLVVDDPEMWEPAYPAIYQVEVVVVRDGGVRDVSRTPFGIRNFRFDVATGFWINGHPLKLHGWGQKPTGTWAGLGAALPDRLHDLTLSMMWEAGGNMLRWGHCAGPPVGAELSDRYGFVTIMPGVDGERDCTGKAWATRTAAFVSTIIYYRNHPSIFVWEGGNYNVSPEHAAEVRALKDQWDPHGHRYFGFRMTAPGMLESVDLELGTIGRTRALPLLPVIETEYDRTEVPRRSWDQYSPPDFGHLGMREKENTYQMNGEQFAVNAVREWWTKFGSDPAHSGGANWIFSDGTHGSRQYTDVARASGEVDAVRLPKEAYWALRSTWNDEPSVHLIGHWNYPPDTVKTMYAVARADSAELFVNGRSLGKGKRSLDTLFTWNDVKFEAGEIRVVATKDGKVVASQVKETAGKPVALKLTPVLDGGWHADGSDVALVDFEVVDAKGRRCPTDEARVDFKISGPAIWRGGYNSGKEASTNHLFLDTEAGINRVSIRSALAPGKVVLTATRDGLKPATLELESLPVELTGGLMEVRDAKPASSLGARPEIDAAALADLAVKRDAAAAAPPQALDSGDRLFSSFQYTGDGAGGVEDKLTEGALAYSDNAVLAFEKLPTMLDGAVIIRTASEDTGYWANDYIVATVAKDMELIVAHDPRVPLPGWLKSYQKCPERLSVNGTNLILYRKALEEGENLRISGNADQGRKVTSPFNVILFGLPQRKDAANP